LRLLFFCATLILSITAAACGDDEDAGDAGNGRLKVVATTVQITALTQEVGGDLIQLHGIIPAGADSHEFEPTASDLRAIEQADVILKNGIGLDDWIDDTLGASETEPVTVTEGIDAIEGGLAEHDDDAGDEHADEHGKDPHVWQDPANAQIMVDNIAAALSDADAENAGAYEANAEIYNSTLEETRDEVQAIIDEIPEEDRKLVTNHDAFGYFANAFGLEVVGAVIPSISTGSEPSAEDTAALLETIERENVKAIFAESSVNASLAETLADDAGVAIVDDLYGDSLGETGSGAETVHGMLLANARKIADALK
jgi:ABC-type Zn uptake system ZnuABC Zn-binding protein ZnuA